MRFYSSHVACLSRSIASVFDKSALMAINSSVPMVTMSQHPCQSTHKLVHFSSSRVQRLDDVIWPSVVDSTQVQKSIELSADGQTFLHRLVATGNLGTLAQIVEHAKTMAIEERHVQKHLLSMMMSLMTEFHELVQHGNSHQNLFFPRADVTSLMNRVNSILLETRGIVNVVNAVKRSLLHVATIENQLDMIDYLIEQKVLVDCVDSYGVTPIEYAISMQHVDCFKRLVAQYNVNYAFSLSETLLHKVASRGNVAMAKYLLEMGANCETVNRNQETPLFYAIYSQRVEMTRYLVELGCRTNHRNNRGLSCVDLAQKCRNPVIRDLVIVRD